MVLIIPAGTTRAPNPASAGRDAAGARASADGTAKASPGLWDAATGGAGLTAKNFGGTEFRAAGLDLGTTKEMFRQGFDRHEIVKAAKDASSLGVPVNKDAPLIADLNRHAPQFMPKAHEVKDDADGIRAVAGSIAENEKRIADLRRKGDHQAADALGKQNDALAQQKDEKQKAYEQHKDDAIQSVPEAHRPKAKKVIEDMDHSLQHDLDKLGQGKKVDIDAAKKVVSDYRQHPDDARVHGRYAALIDAGKKNGATRMAAASIDERLKRAAQMRDQKLASADAKERVNAGKAVAKTAAVESNDDMLASLSSPTDTKLATKTEPEKATSKSEPSKPMPSKTAQAKPATLHA